MLTRPETPSGGWQGREARNFQCALLVNLQDPPWRSPERKSFQRERPGTCRVDLSGQHSFVWGVACFSTQADGQPGHENSDPDPPGTLVAAGGFRLHRRGQTDSGIDGGCRRFLLWMESRSTGGLEMPKRASITYNLISLRWRAEYIPLRSMTPGKSSRSHRAVNRGCHGILPVEPSRAILIRTRNHSC